MAVNQAQLIATLREQVAAIDEAQRCSGYHQDLLDTLARILEIERASKLQRMATPQAVTGQCENLGLILHEGGWRG
jgi:hypothetical protein